MNRRTFIQVAITFGVAGVVLAQQAAKPDRLSGVVKGVDKSSSTIELRPRKTGSSVVRKVIYDSSTQFTLDGKPATADDVKENLRIVAVGKFEGVNLKATNITLKHH